MGWGRVPPWTRCQERHREHVVAWGQSSDRAYSEIIPPLQLPSHHSWLPAHCAMCRDPGVGGEGGCVHWMNWGEGVGGESVRKYIPHAPKWFDGSDRVGGSVCGLGWLEVGWGVLCSVGEMCLCVVFSKSNQSTSARARSRTRLGVAALLWSHRGPGPGEGRGEARGRWMRRVASHHNPLLPPPNQPITLAPQLRKHQRTHSSAHKHTHTHTHTHIGISALKMLDFSSLKRAEAKKVGELWSCLLACVLRVACVHDRRRCVRVMMWTLDACVCMCGHIDNMFCRHL